MPFGSYETQLLAPVLYTTHRKHALSDLRGVCMPHTFVHPLYVWMPPYLDTPHMFAFPHVLGNPLYIHNTKKTCFVRLRECLYIPIHLDAPPFFDTPIGLDAPCMFGHPLFVWISTYVWMLLICLDTPCMFGHSLCLYTPAHNNIKRAYIVRLRGCPYVPHMFGCPQYVCMPPYVWTFPVYSDASHMFGCPLYVCMTSKYIGKPKGMGCSTYRGYQNIWGYPNIQGISKHMGHPNIQGGVQTYGASKHTGGI